MKVNRDTVVEAFTALAPSYERSMDRELRGIWGLEYGPFVQELVGALSLPAGHLVLDLATGTARIPRSLAGHTAAQVRSFGLDITPAMLHHGQASLQALGLENCIDLVCGSGMAMPFAAGRFDLAICALGTHHLDLFQALAEVARVLKGDGTLLLLEVGARRWWKRPVLGWLMKAGTFLYFLFTHRAARAWAEVEGLNHVYLAEEWRQILAAQGFGQADIQVRFRGRRFWYPDALIITTKKGGECAQGG